MSEVAYDAGPFPLTEIQYAYWVGRGPNFVLGNVAPHAYFELTGRRLDPELLTASWRRIIARHGMLRAVVDTDGNQRILDTVPDFEIAVEDLRAADSAEAGQRVEEIRGVMSHRVFDPAQWPLFDLRLTRLPEHDLLHVSLDLLMVDLASVAVLFSEWSTLCKQPDTILPEIDVSFRDYVLALEDTKGTSRSRRSLDYWAGRAESLLPPPDLPLRKSPASVHKPVFTHREFQLPPQSWQILQDRCRSHGLTPTAVLATAFAEVLRLWSGSDRFTLNLTVFNRLPLVLATDGAGHRKVHPHLSRVVGDFTSICLLEMDLTAGTSFTDRVGRTQTQLQQDLRHRYVSALHTLRERRRRGLQSGFETMPVVFTSGLGTVADMGEPSDYFGDISYRVSQTPQVWLDHQVVDITGSLDLSWDAIEEMFPAGLLDAMFSTYCMLITRLAEEDQPWADDGVVQAPTGQLATRMLANDTAAPLPTGLLQDGFLARAAADPDRLAVVGSTGAVTYGELARQSAGIAAAVLATAPEGATLHDQPVAITLAKGADQVAAAYGVLLAGGAYLPVGAQLPARRRRQLYEEAGATVVVTRTAVADQQEWPDGVRLVRLDDLPADLPATGQAAAGPSDLAYIIYTSGSTGTPKGVEIEHRAALNTVCDINERFGVGPDDRVFGLADLGFDLSVYDLFGALAVGATLVLPDPEGTGDPFHWVTLMEKHGITVWNSVPAQMQMLVEHVEITGEVPTGLRLVMLSGDWIPVDLPGRINALWPDATVISLGGATEAAIWSIYHEVRDLDPAAPSVPYGKPLRNQAFHVLSSRWEDCPDWVPGELYIAGDGLARGYRHDADKTAASFVREPHQGTRLYRTGDFGRYLPDGSIQFLGRRDGQVKIGGHRIELGEIEAVLQSHPAVAQAVTVKSTNDGGPPRLLSYVLPASQDNDLFVVEHADPDRTAINWKAMTGTPDTATPGPAPQELRALWSRLDDLYVAAVAAALRTLALPHRPGDLIDPETVNATAGIVPRYARWTRRALGALVGGGFLAQEPDGLRVVRELPGTIPAGVSTAAAQALRDTLAVPDDLADWLIAVAGGLAELLTQRVHSAELYASDRTQEVYARLFGPTYHVATEALRRTVANWPADQPLRILEVGAGYGSLTRELLPLLPADRTEYVFTDISKFFLQRAGEAFSEYPFLQYDLLDLDREPQTQGFADHRADLIVAASVLHDTRHLQRTLGQLTSLLAPGGLLLLIEQTQFHPWFDLTMGLQQGFDNFEDTELRQHHPLLDQPGWESVLAAAGFQETAVLCPADGPASVGFDVVIARGPQERRRFVPQRLRDFVGEQLPKYMVPASVHLLDKIPVTATGKVDRAALAKAGARSTARGRPAQPPRTERQRKLVEIWQEVLGVPTVDLADDFLDAGGDSLLAARLVAAIQRTFDVTVPIAVVLEHPTVAGLDGYLEPIVGPSPDLEAK